MSRAIRSKFRQHMRSVQNWSASRDDVKFQFKCTQCGKCCTGNGGRVRINGRERDEMAQYLELSRAEFTEKYTTSKYVSPFWILKQSDDDTQCIFLDDSKCSIYPVRPTQCRTFPWWPQHLISDYDWRLAARHCEGITVNSQNDELPLIFSDILPETITYNIHQSGENYTYNELKEMLSDLCEVDPAIIDDYKHELAANFHRNIVYHDEAVTVLDTVLHNDGAAVNRTRSFMFNDRLHLTQSEMPLGLAVGGNLACVDPSQPLMLDVHRVMTVCFAWLNPESPLRVAIIGSGAGALVRFLLHRIPAITHMDAVEPNKNVNRIAREFFGLSVEEKKIGERFTLHEMDGETFVRGQVVSHSKFDCMLIDVESGERDETPSISNIVAPPASMLDTSFLESVDTLLAPHGILVVNIIVTDDAAFERVVTTFIQAYGVQRCVYIKLLNNYVIYVLGPSYQLPIDTLQNMAKNVTTEIEQNGGIRGLTFV